MKKLVATTLATALVGLAAYAQGTINLANIVPGTINAPIFQGDGTTKLVGPVYAAGLLAGPTATSLAFIGSPVAFLTGPGAGYIPATTETVPTVAAGAVAYAQFVAWNVTLYPTFAAAKASGLPNVWGQSASVYTITTGGSGSPPALPAPLTGLTSFNLVVPEPSTFALAGLGAAALMIFRRRK